MNFNFKLANKDKRLLLTVLIVVIIVGAIIVYKKIDDKVTDMEKQKNELQLVKNDLTEKYARKGEYTLKTKVYEYLYSSIINNYSLGLDQPTVIMDLVDIEKKTETWIKQAGLTEIGTAYQFGQVASSNPAGVEGGAVYTTDLVGTNTSTSISYECGYDQLKDLITRINDADHKYSIGTMVMSYNDAEDIVSGSFTLGSYAITGANRQFIPLDVNGVPLGTENIFISKTHDAHSVDKSDIDVIKSDYDMYVTLNAATSDVDSMAVGLRNDVLGESKLVLNSNTKEVITINVSGSVGKYKVSYKLGDNTYPVDYEAGKDLVVGDTLDVLVVSSPRIGDDDLSQATINIVNKSDKELNLGILNDDDAKPRCIVGTTEGKVHVVH